MSNVESNAQKIDYYLEKHFLASESMKNCIGGVILYDETIKQSSSSQKKFQN